MKSLSELHAKLRDQGFGVHDEMPMFADVLEALVRGTLMMGDVSEKRFDEHKQWR